MVSTVEVVGEIEQRKLFLILKSCLVNLPLIKTPVKVS